MSSKGYSAKEEFIISSLLSTTTVQEASNISGVPTRTIYGYLKRDVFMEKYKKARADMITQATYRLQYTLSEAADVLREILNDTSHNGHIRVSAGRTILEYGYKFTEQLDIVQRLEMLEKQIEADNGINTLGEGEIY